MFAWPVLFFKLLRPSVVQYRRRRRDARARKTHSKRRMTKRIARLTCFNPFPRCMRPPCSCSAGVVFVNGFITNITFLMKFRTVHCGHTVECDRDKSHCDFAVFRHPKIDKIIWRLTEVSIQFVTIVYEMTTEETCRRRDPLS